MRPGALLVAISLSVSASSITHAAAASNMTASIRMGASGTASISFGPDRSLETTVIGPIGGAYLTPMNGGPQVSIALAMQQPNEGVPIIGYKVTKESFGSAPLCPTGPTVAIVVMYPRSGPQKLAAIAGATPGDPGSRLCALYELSVNNPPIPEQVYQ